MTILDSINDAKQNLNNRAVLTNLDPLSEELAELKILTEVSIGLDEEPGLEILINTIKNLRSSLDKGQFDDPIAIEKELANIREIRDSVKSCVSLAIDRLECLQSITVTIGNKKLSTELKRSIDDLNFIVREARGININEIESKLIRVQETCNNIGGLSIKIETSLEESLGKDVSKNVVIDLVSNGMVNLDSISRRELEAIRNSEISKFFQLRFKN